MSEPVPARAVVRVTHASEPPRPRAYCARAILIANLGVYAWCAWLAGQIVLIAVPAPVLIALGANVAPFTQYAPEPTALVTATFLHGGLMHLAFNMVALFQIGPLVEEALGRARFCVLYVSAGIAASVVSMLASNYGLLEAGVAVGASGAICGLIGAAAVLGYRLQGAKSPLARAMLRWLLITVAFGYVVTLTGRASIDNYAHVGGALFGGLLAFTFRRGVTYTPLGRALRIGASAAVVVGAFVWQVLFAAPARDRAKMDYLLGRCEALREDLRELGVTPRAGQAIHQRCTETLREH